MNKAFSIGEAVMFGWEKVKANSGLVFGVTITMVALQMASSMLQKGAESSLASGLGSLALAFVSIVLGAGTLVIFLKLAQGGSARYRDIVPAASLAWRYFCVSLVTGIVAFLPLMLAGLIDLALLASTGAINFSEGTPAQGSGPMIAVAAVIALAGLVGALYFSLRYSFARVAAIEGHGINESMRASSKQTNGVKWRLVLLILALIGLNILGVVALFVGLLVSIPVSLFAYIHVYLKLKEASN